MGKCTLLALQGCNLAHVLGLYKMSGASGAAFSLTYRGALADMMLWVIFRLQTRVFSSNTYDRYAGCTACIRPQLPLFMPLYVHEMSIMTTSPPPRFTCPHLQRSTRCDLSVWRSAWSMAWQKQVAFSLLLGASSPC